MLKKSEEEKILQTLKSCKDFGNATEYYKELKIYGDKLKKNRQTSKMIKLFEALGNPDRIFILESLKNQDRCVCELESILQKSQPAISHHLKVLKNSNLIRGWQKGKFTHFSLVKTNFQEALKIFTALIEETTNWSGNV